MFSPATPSDKAYAEIASFLKDVGQSSLFDYYGLPRDADDGAIADAILARRKWAQSQQANPKFKNEARWLIRNHGLVQRVLLERRKAYLRQVEKRKLSRNLEILSLFVRGTMATGRLSPEAARAVREEAKKLSIPESYADKLIEKLAGELGVVLERSKPPEGRSGQRRSVAQALMRSVRDIVARGSLTPEEVNHLLEQGRQRGMDEQSLRALVERVAAGAEERRRDADLPIPAPPTNAKQATLDDEIRSDAIREIVDTVRGAMLQGILSMSTLRSVHRRGVQLGLDARTVELLVAEAKRAGEQAMDGRLDPYAVLNVDPDIDEDGLREAYQDMRRWALGLPSQSEGARACVLLDMAWTMVRTPRARARYDARRPDRGAER
ncbi:MAG: hypothetical protein H6739_01690 [Alphaproteobacteria bacterium]|nr:hypothetical protein [Alphaproteobacteria bacterium]